VIKKIEADYMVLKGIHLGEAFYHIVVYTDSEEPREDFMHKYNLLVNKPYWSKIRRIWREFEQEYWYSILGVSRTAFEILSELMEATNYYRRDK
jgi:hypothetical protein